MAVCEHCFLTYKLSRPFKWDKRTHSFLRMSTITSWTSYLHSLNSLFELLFKLLSLLSLILCLITIISTYYNLLYSLGSVLSALPERYHLILTMTQGDARYENFTDEEIEIKSTAHSHMESEFKLRQTTFRRQALNHPLDDTACWLQHRPSLPLSIRMQLRLHR